MSIRSFPKIHYFQNILFTKSNKLVNNNKQISLSHEIISFQSLFLSSKLCYFYTKSRQRSSQQLLKQYFSTRLTLSTSQLKNYMIQLSKISNIKTKDHRWQNLYMTIQKYHNDFNLNSKIQIINALAKVKQNNALFLTLYKDIIAQFHQLNINQISVLIWSMVKVKEFDKNVVMAIYKKLYKILENNQQIILTKAENDEYINNQKVDQAKINYNDEQPQKQMQSSQSKPIYLTQTNFTLLIWSLQRTKIIDDKLLISLLKHTFQSQPTQSNHHSNQPNVFNQPNHSNQSTSQNSSKQQNHPISNNISQLRIQNLCLLLYSLSEIHFLKYRITNTILNKIMSKYQQLQNVSVLTLMILLDSSRKCIVQKENYLIKYAKEVSSQKKTNIEENINKERKFFLFILQMILIKHQEDVNKNSKKMYKRKKYEEETEFKKLSTPLSPKFASQIIFNLGVLNIYDKQIYYKVLSSLTDNIDQAQTQDLSMALCGICNLKIVGINTQQKNQHIYEHKKIICKRIFQIYTSINGKSLSIIKDLVHNKRIQNQLVPARVRKEVQHEYMMKKNQKENQSFQGKSKRKQQKKAYQQQYK